MNYYFPIAFGANYFSILGLMVYASLIGQRELAADVGIVQASAVALFYVFSANARSLILNRTSKITASDILNIRATLVVPLGVAAIFLSVYVSNVAWILATLLVIRKGTEWLADVYLSRSEVDEKILHAKIYFSLQCITLLSVFISAYLYDYYFYAALLLWAISPLIIFVEKIINIASYKLRKSANLENFLPHLGSTAGIGIGVYAFRLILISIVGKELAGDLFAAFAIGSFFVAVFIHAIGPSLILQNISTSQSPLLKYFHIYNIGFAAAGVILVGLSWGQANVELFLSKDGLFVSTLGFSMIGGALMIYAQHARLKIIQTYEHFNVYGPDVLVNLVFISSVPFLYFIFGGSRVLPILYLISAIINYIFYKLYYIQITRLNESVFKQLSYKNLIYIVSGFILIPIFFQINACIQDMCIFNNTSWNFDTGGTLNNLPIPFSIFACMLGFLVFNDYKKSMITVTTVLMLFVAMIISTVVTTGNQLEQQQAKMTLMMQFILPSFSMILGQLLYRNIKDLKLIANSFLVIIAILVPAHLLITWLNGSLLLIPHLYLFSFYQHIQYGPVIILSAYIFCLFTLNEELKYRKILFVLMPLVGLYLAASTSKTSFILYLLGISIFIYYQWKIKAKRSALVLIIPLISIFCMASYLGYALSNTTESTRSDPFQAKFHLEVDPKDWSVKEITEGIKAPKETDSRFFYWKYYAKGIIADSKSMIFGNKERPDRTIYASAHNYYLDISYNFGIIALIPILVLIFLTLGLIIRHRQYIISSQSLLGVTFIALFMILFENFFKVGFRQPYPGIYSFFIWGLLIAALSNANDKPKTDEN